MADRLRVGQRVVALAARLGRAATSEEIAADLGVAEGKVLALDPIDDAASDVLGVQHILGKLLIGSGEQQVGPLARRPNAASK